MRCTAAPFFVIVLLAACTNDALSPASSELNRQANVGVSTLSTLTAVNGQGAGYVKVTPTAHDVAGPGSFDVQGTVNVVGAVPQTTFTVLRRVDLVPDGVCTGAAWLTLPPPNAPSFTTSEGGAGALHFQISRGAPFVDGVRFDVQWQLAGSDGSRLDSECFTVTVR